MQSAVYQIIRRLSVSFWHAYKPGALAFAGLAGASKELQIVPLDLNGLNGLAGHIGVVASSVDSEATFSDALLGSSAPSPSTVLPLHPSQVNAAAA